MLVDQMVLSFSIRMTVMMMCKCVWIMKYVLTSETFALIFDR